jgi:hypothetical protein
VKNLRPLSYAEVQRRIAEFQADGGATILPFTDEELAARRAIETRRGEPYAEAEWKQAAANLRAFFGVLAEWQQPRP